MTMVGKLRKLSMSTSPHMLQSLPSQLDFKHGSAAPFLWFPFVAGNLPHLKTENCVAQQWHGIQAKSHSDDVFALNEVAGAHAWPRGQDLD